MPGRSNPDRSVEHNSSVWVEQLGLFATIAGPANKKLIYDGLLGGLRQAHQAFRGQTGDSFLCFFNFFLNPSAGVLPFLLAERNP
jgi:hypothetical protein